MNEVPANLPAKPRVAKHLMTPGQPQRQLNREPMSIGSVQKWVGASILCVTLGIHSTFMGFAASTLDSTGRQIGMLVIAGIFGIIAPFVTLLIHGKSPVSPWLILGVIPAAAWAVYMYA